MKGVRSLQSVIGVVCHHSNLGSEAHVHNQDPDILLEKSITYIEQVAHSGMAAAFVETMEPEAHEIIE
jgi:hypothetical protein